MQIPEEFETLLDQGRSLVEKHLKEKGAFTVFALALQEDGEVTTVTAGEQFADLGRAIGEVLKVLIPWAKARQITANVVCSPIPQEAAGDGWNRIMFDLENRDGWRLYVILPYRRHDYLGWQYGNTEYKRGKNQLFAA